VGSDAVTVKRKDSDQESRKLIESKPVKYQKFIKLQQNFSKQEISIIFGDYPFGTGNFF
jgi:hypothetical protein